MNPVRLLSAKLGIILLTLPFAGAARGELITFQFSGTVTEVTVVPGFGLQDFDFPDVGDPFTGFYRFDSNAQDTANSAEQGSFQTVLTERAVATSVGQFQLDGRISGIVTFQDYYEAGGGVGITSHPDLAQILTRNNFSLVVTKENLFSNPNVLPLTPPSLAGATGASLRMAMRHSLLITEFPLVEIIGSLDSLTIVPEPSGSVLLGVGTLLGLRIRMHDSAFVHKQLLLKGICYNTEKMVATLDN